MTTINEIVTLNQGNRRKYIVIITFYSAIKPHRHIQASVTVL